MHGLMKYGAPRRAALGLTVDGDRVSSGGSAFYMGQYRSFHHFRHPGGEALLKGQRVEQAEDPSEGVVRGDAAGQLEEGLEPSRSWSGLKLRPCTQSSAPAEDGAGGDENDLVESVDSPLFASGIGQSRRNDRGVRSGRGQE